MRRPLGTVGAVALLLLASASVGADEFYKTYLVLGYFADGSAPERARLAEARHDYVAQFGRELASFRLLDDDANVIGEGAWVAHSALDAVEAIVADDPFRRAGLYREVSIRETDLYLLDAWFAIAPRWRQGPALEGLRERQAGETPRLER